MLQTLIIVLVGVGVLSTAAALYTTDNGIAILAGVVGSFSAGLATYGLFNIEVVSNGTVVAVGSQPAIALFTATLAMLAAYPALTGPIDLVGESMDDSDPFGREGI
jgi:cytochrome c biogenesis protein CcdA